MHREELEECYSKRISHTHKQTHTHVQYTHTHTIHTHTTHLFFNHYYLQLVTAWSPLRAVLEK
uniref:Uncharacterized protein n=1 Tax=Anguilla anguilla TaxID=7936 RepID=A0A0E9XZU3_ANGAN